MAARCSPWPCSPSLGARELPLEVLCISGRQAQLPRLLESWTFHATPLGSAVNTCSTFCGWLPTLRVRSTYLPTDQGTYS